MKKYTNDENFKTAKQHKANEMYLNNDSFCSNKRQKRKEIYQKNVDKMKKINENFAYVPNNFRISMKDELQHVCCICHMLLFSYHVTEISLEFYEELGKDRYENALHSY